MVTKKRKALSKKVRFEVFKRDGFCCVYCGATPIQNQLQADHVIAVSAGGTNDIDNLVTACQPCNIGKGKNSLQSIPTSMAEKARQTLDREQQVAEYTQIMMDRRERIEQDVWEVANTFNRRFAHKEWEFDSRGFASIKVFIERAGLADCLDGAEIAISKNNYWSYPKTFRYFCGVMWNKINPNRNKP